MKYVLYFSFIKDIGYKNHDVTFADFLGCAIWKK